ncbi:hypothetical protein [Nannocystis pusilla]|nr:hypothetical protein [Nannocystis pusilla]
MAPDIALDNLAPSPKPLRVLDPMMGSGTVLAVARSRGHKAHGIDIDPLAVLLSRVWTSNVEGDDVRLKAKEVLRRAMRLHPGMRADTAFPPDADRETIDFLRYWFDARARKQLFCLATAIRGVRSVLVRDALWCAFSRLIITKQAGCSLALDLSHSRPHKAFTVAPSVPFERFLSAVERVVQGIVVPVVTKAPHSTPRHGDARKLPFSRETIDLVLTSPPYLNAIDYMRCSKFTLVWMGHRLVDLRNLRSVSIGSEATRTGIEQDKFILDVISKLSLSPPLSRRHNAMLARYTDDMRKSVGEVARVLVKGGKAIYVIGENTIRGTYIGTSEILRAVAEFAGLELSERSDRELPPNRRYLPPPQSHQTREHLDARMRREVVLTFQKS